MDTALSWERLMRSLKQRVDTMITRAVIDLVNDRLKTQRLQLELLEGETVDDVEHMQPYGLSFVPPDGAEALALAVGGMRQHTVAICAQHPDERPKNGKPRTGGIYTRGAWRLFVDEEGLVHIGAETGVTAAARADKVDAEFARIWTLLTTWTVTPQDGGAALKAKALTEKPKVQQTGADKTRIA